MQAAWLFHCHPRVACRDDGVQRSGWPGEEAVGVEVRAPDLVGLDHLVSACPTQEKRPLTVAELLGALPVDHRPLVQAEAAQVCRASGRRGQELRDESDRGGTAFQEGLEIQGRGVIGIPVELPLVALRGTFEREPQTWVPATQLG